MAARPPQSLVEQYLQRPVQDAAIDEAHFKTYADGAYRLLKGWLPQSTQAVCVDLGCGCGRMLYLLQRLGMRNLTGVDLCESELGVARQFVSAELVCKDILTFLQELPAQAVDFISAMNLLEHLADDDLLAVMTECRRVLRPGGALVAQVPNGVSPFAGATRFWDVSHRRAFTTASLTQLACLAGFGQDNIEFVEWGPRAHGVKSAVRVLLWQVIRLCIWLYLQIECRSARGGIYTSDLAFRVVAAAGNRGA